MSLYDQPNNIYVFLFFLVETLQEMSGNDVLCVLSHLPQVTYICIRIHTHIYVCIYICIHICVYMCIYIYMRVCVCVCVCVCLQMYDSGKCEKQEEEACGFCLKFF